MKVKVKDISFDEALKCKADGFDITSFSEQSRERWNRCFRGKEAEILQIASDKTFKCGNAIYRIKVAGFPMKVRMCSDMLEMD